MKLFVYIVLILFIASLRNVCAQSNTQYLKVGDKLPDLTFHQVSNFHANKIRLSDYKGKLIIIDFWAVWCGSCIRAFPTLDSLQKDFKDQVVILPVTIENGKKVNELIRRIPSLRKLSLPLITNDTAIRKRFEQIGLPLDVVVDKNGIIKAITDVEELNKSTISHFIKGDTIQVTERAASPHINSNMPLFLEDKGETVLRHFLLTKYLPGELSMSLEDKLSGSDGYNHVLIANLPLLQLIKIEATKRGDGNVKLPDNKVRLTVSDTSKYITPTNVSESDYFRWCSKNLYCVDVVVPSNDTDLFSYMKYELEYNFHYKSQFKTESVDCYVLKIIDSNRFKITPKSRHIKAIFDGGNLSWSIINLPLDELVFRLNEHSKIPIVDETGFKSYIEIYNLKPAINNFDMLKAELNKVGVDLIRAKRQMQILYISDI